MVNQAIPGKLMEHLITSQRGKAVVLLQMDPLMVGKLPPPFYRRWGVREKNGLIAQTVCVNPQTI